MHARSKKTKNTAGREMQKGYECKGERIGGKDGKGGKKLEKEKEEGGRTREKISVGGGGGQGGKELRRR